MCRISILTATDIPRFTTALLLNDLMLRSNADGQPDGWGVYSHGDDFIYKSAGGYFHNNSDWMQSFMEANGMYPTGFMLGHTRAASVQTSRTEREAHPFKFLNEDGSVRFVAAHNGFINNSFHGYTYNAADPQVDSFRVFTRLSDMIGQDGEITADLIDAWAEVYEHDSAFVITIIRNGKLYLFRNNKRVLHYAEVGNGFVFNTSLDVLRATREYAKHMLGILIAEPRLVNDNVLFEITPAEHTVMVSDLRLPLVPPKWQQQVHTVPAAAETESASTETTSPLVRLMNTDEPEIEVEVRADETEDDLTPWWYRNKDTRPRKEHDAQWDEIRKLLNPCRSGIASLYAVMFTYADKIEDDIMDCYGRTKVDPNWQSLNDEQLRIFRDYLLAKPLSGTQRRTINKWNRLVDGSLEVDEQIYAFGSTLFFHLPHLFVEDYFKEVMERAA